MRAAPRFFATRRSEEALRSGTHRRFLAFCSAAIKPVPFSKVTYASLLINMVIRYPVVAGGTADEFRTLFLKVASGNAQAQFQRVACVWSSRSAKLTRTGTWYCKRITCNPKSTPVGRSLAKDLGIVCKLNLHLDASAIMCLGKSKHVSVPHTWIPEASKSEKFVTKKVGAHVNSADLMTKPLPRPRIEQLLNLMSYRFVELYRGQSEVHRAKSVCPQQIAE